jgi:hypothetical protein
MIEFVRKWREGSPDVEPPSALYVMVVREKVKSNSQLPTRLSANSL